MRNALNIYKRKDGRFEGRIPFGRNDNTTRKYSLGEYPVTPRSFL